MNKLYLRIKELAERKHISLAKVERDLGFSNGIISTWKNGKASQDKIDALADYFDVTTDYLLGRTDTPQFTRKDERDVQKILEEMTEGLNNKNELAFLKNGGEEIDEDDAELLRASLENVIRQSKLLAKQKFTPKNIEKIRVNEVTCMLSKEWIKHKAHEVVYSAGTRDPFKICEEAGIPYYYYDLGKQIMAYHTIVRRIPSIILSTRNTEFENQYSCGHELGHHFCRHQGNTECLNRNNRKFVTFGEEYEANKFMVDIMLDGINPHDFETKEQLMKHCHIPIWAERYIDWDLLI